jgi:tRNA 2-thiouridine synthesizing protein B
MSTLHTINKSAFTHTTLNSCIQVCSPNDGIILLEDGVFGALTSAPYAQELSRLINAGNMVYALECDVQARGLGEKIRRDIATTDYQGFVQLSIDFKRIQSWY